ncbi:unnamed protein product [Lactuca saligna]|uniref:Uncharacterized protein n=1 Tax=Lactuca saligna TaxID=75948 RepID=A0AA35ZBF3_LACSI|nr:unnamed protein product [Lactuca saligna]
MEDHPKDDNNKKNIKAMPPAISIGGGGGAGRLGMGGILLFGGALVTATIVSAALAFKIRRSSKKSRWPSPETQSVDAPDQVEFMVKTNKDLPLGSQNQSDGLTSMKEIMQTKTIPDSSPEEKQKCEEKVAVESGDVDGGEEEQKKYCNQQTDSEEEEYKAIEGVGESIQVGALASDEESTAAMEVDGVKKEKEKDCEDEMINVANVEGELSTSDEASYAAADHDIVSETEEEAINTVFCVRVENKEACLDDDDDDDETITIQTQEMHQSRTFVVDDDDDDRAAVREKRALPPNQLIMMNKEEQGKDEDKECEVQSMNKDKETPYVDAEAELLMITEDELGKSKVEADDEILLIQSHATTAKSEVGISADESVQWEEEASHIIEESMKEDDSILLGKGHKTDDHHKHKHHKSFTHRHRHRFAEISLVPSPTLLLIFMLLALGTGIQRYLVK